jgi:hypothetical protein
VTESLNDTEGQVNEPYIAWNVERNLNGLLSSVRSGDLEYMRPDSTGLFLRDFSGKDHPLGGTGNGGPKSVRVIRDGALAVGLRFEFVETDAVLENVRSVVDLLFPVFKSWVEVDWQIDDPQGKLSGVGAKLGVNVDQPTRNAPTLVDFGATSLVYLSLRPGQEAQLRGGPSIGRSNQESSGGLLHAWQVLRGKPGQMEPFVFGPKRPDGLARPEGWAHVMDRNRCLAIAVDGFAHGTEDCILVSAEGTVQLHRQFPTGEGISRPGAKRLRFWLHFVPFPPQQTAATSPQSMQNPVATRVVCVRAD